MNSDCQRVWLFFTEFNYADAHVRELYTQRVEYLCNYVISHKDKFVIVVPKIDMYSFVCAKNKTEKYHHIYTSLRHQYPNFMKIFANTNSITRLFRLYNCDVIAFSAGLFTTNVEGKPLHSPGDSSYPQLLWKKITKLL